MSNIFGDELIIRLGLPGSGKTLDQTIRDVWPALVSGEKVYCSYWINWKHPNLHYFNTFDQIENVRNAYIVFDEIGQILPARDWAAEGLRVQMFFQLHRHRYLNIIANTQDVSLVSKTVGIVASNWYLCESKMNFIIRNLVKLTGLPLYVYTRVSLSYSQLKKAANGWELDGTFPEAAAPSLLSSLKVVNLHRFTDKYYDKYKIEKVHKYCPNCRTSYHDTIPLDQTKELCSYNWRTGRYTLKTPENCPYVDEFGEVCGHSLQVRLSGLYDTAYEPNVADTDYIVKAFKRIKVDKMVECSIFPSKGTTAPLKAPKRG